MFMARGYQTTQQLYESENSIIYRAVRDSDRRPVILKVLKALEPPPEGIARFKREYMLTRELNLPGVVEVYDHIQTENHWVIIEEDFAGESLAHLKLAGQISMDRFLGLAIEITGIVAAIHQKLVIHKDINPSNIVLNPVSNVVKIIDFGISASKLAEETVAFEHPTLLEGTPGYLSPEQTGRINRPLDYRTDFYSLGCTFYHLLTGVLPFSTGDLLELIHAHLARVPKAPHELRPEIHAPLSAIVLKLMAKNPDERYQSAHGLKVDLVACQAALQQPPKGSAPLDLGKADILTHFRLPARLYGRAKEIAELLAAFDRVSAGETSLIMVTGYSGIGKSAVVKELYGPITERKGFFVSGKFEQYERNVPYAPIIEAFQALIQQLLCEPESQIASWRDRILHAVGPSCAVLIEVIPQLELVTGALPPPVPLPPRDTHFRFTRAIREFVRLFAQKAHPLVLFLDDLQWSDSASLDFIKSLTTSDKVPHLFILGAYRDNEVGPGHPLAMALKDITIAARLHVSPLDLSDVALMIGDTFRAPESRTASLAELAHNKTSGNPFFLGEFLKALHADKLVHFVHETGTWEWDMDQISTRDITDNVVELLIEKLHRLTPESQTLLKWAACIGSRFDLHTLKITTDLPVKQITAGLVPALSEGFMLPLNGNYRLFEADVLDLEQRVEVEYKFAHDRIQQAAYTLIPEEEKRAMHLHIGRRLKQEARWELHKVVNQLNIAGDLVTDRAERSEIARLNLRTGEKAKDSAANDAAFKFFTAGLSFLLPPAHEGSDSAPLRFADAEVHASEYELTLKLTAKATEAAYLTGNFKAMAQLAESGLAHAANWEDKVEIYQVKINALLAQSRLLPAIDMAREILEPLGVSFPAQPDQADIDDAIEEVDRALGGRSPESLVDFVQVTAAKPHASALRLLNSVFIVAFHTNPTLATLIAARGVHLSLLHGCTDESITGFLHYGMALCGQDHIERGNEFGRLARALIHGGRKKEHLAELCTVGGGFIFHWKESLQDVVEDMRRGYQAGFDAGHISSASNCMKSTVTTGFSAGIELKALQTSMRDIMVHLAKFNQRHYLTSLRMFGQAIANLTGDVDDPGLLKGDLYDEEKEMPVHRANNDVNALFIAHYVKLILLYRFHEHRRALACVTEHLTQNNLPGSPFLPVINMYHSLSQLAIYSEESSIQQELIRLSVARNQDRLRTWASHAPMNYSHKYHLVEAELGRVLGQDMSAREHYDQAIDLAREHHYPNEESLALERAALFLRERGRLRLARYYFRDAYHAYQRWGAEAKLKELRQRYPELLALAFPSARRELRSSPSSGREGTLTTGELPDIDLETVLQASRAISTESEPSRLLEKVLSICLKHAGARRGFLILARRDELIVKAEGALEGDITIRLFSVALKDQEGLSQGIVHYVAKTSEPILLDNASTEGPFKNDPHIRTNGCLSVLCIPIVYQGTLMGVAYMENNHTPGAFTASRLEVLGLLMAQAAVSIENALLRSAGDAQDFQFSVGGSLTVDTPSYVLREADRELTQRIQQGKFCYVFNARQMGKSSLRVHAMSQLNGSGYRSVAVDLTSIGSETLTAEQWYAGIARSIVSGLDLARDTNLRTWWRDRAFFSPVQRLSQLVDEVVLDRISQPIAIFIDEIDMVLSLDFSFDDFFALIRSFYNKRADDRRYERLSFVLLGVATPTDLIRDRTRTPFNIGHAIPLSGFRYAESRTLARGLAGIGDPDLVLRAILTWTDGQPFLTQKLCQLARLAESRPSAGKERDWVTTLVRDRVIDRWRARDEPEHLKTIEARILRSPSKKDLLALYREILERGGAPALDTLLESELTLSGLVVREWGRLRVGNLIYASVFDLPWLEEETTAD